MDLQISSLDGSDGVNSLVNHFVLDGSGSEQHDSQLTQALLERHIGNQLSQYEQLQIAGSQLTGNPHLHQRQFDQNQTSLLQLDNSDLMTNTEKKMNNKDPGKVTNSLEENETKKKEKKKRKRQKDEIVSGPRKQGRPIIPFSDAKKKGNKLKQLDDKILEIAGGEEQKALLLQAYKDSQFGKGMFSNSEESDSIMQIGKNAIQLLHDLPPMSPLRQPLIQALGKDLAPAELRKALGMSQSTIKRAKSVKMDESLLFTLKYKPNVTREKKLRSPVQDMHERSMQTVTEVVPEATSLTDDLVPGAVPVPDDMNINMSGLVNGHGVVLPYHMTMTPSMWHAVQDGYQHSQHAMNQTGLYATHSHNHTNLSSGNVG